MTPKKKATIATILTPFGIAAIILAILGITKIPEPTLTYIRLALSAGLSMVFFGIVMLILYVVWLQYYEGEL